MESEGQMQRTDVKDKSAIKSVPCCGVTVLLAVLIGHVAAHRHVPACGCRARRGHMQAPPAGPTPQVHRTEAIPTCLMLTANPQLTHTHTPRQAHLHPTLITHIPHPHTQATTTQIHIPHVPTHLVNAPHDACTGCDLHTARQPRSSSRASLGTARRVSKKRSVSRARCLGSADSSRGDTHSRASRVRELPHTSSAKAESGPAGGASGGVEEREVEAEGWVVAIGPSCGEDEGKEGAAWGRSGQGGRSAAYYLDTTEWELREAIDESMGTAGGIRGVQAQQVASPRFPLGPPCTHAGSLV